MQNKQEFITYLRDFFRYRYNIKLPAIILDEWWEDLKDYESTDVYEALRIYRQDEVLGVYAPKISNILSLLKPFVKKKSKSNKCEMIIDGVQCSLEGKYLLLDGRIFCTEHHADQFMDSDIKEFITNFKKRAVEEGLSMKELFRIQNNISDARMRYLENNPGKILAEILGKK